MKREELKYYGFYACLKLWESRPDDVIRVYLEKRHVKELSALLKWCASKSKAYHIVSPDEMSKITDSVHHEGLCILAKELPQVSFNQMMSEINKTKDPLCLLFLDGVQNPHNIGSILRICAHFGVRYILGEKKSLPKLSPSAYRVAQGGAEYTHLIGIEKSLEAFQKLEKAGFRIITTSSHGSNTLYDYKFPPRTLILMGSESEGIQQKNLHFAKVSLLIPGTGSVESLNVSVATGLFLGEYYRQMR